MVLEGSEYFVHCIHADVKNRKVFYLKVSPDDSVAVNYGFNLHDDAFAFEAAFVGN